MFCNPLLNFYYRCNGNSWTVSLFTPSSLPLAAYNRFVGVETAAFPGQSEKEIDRLLHLVRLMIQTLCVHTELCQVVVGGGPTGVEVR